MWLTKKDLQVLRAYHAWNPLTNYADRWITIGSSSVESKGRGGKTRTKKEGGRKVLIGKDGTIKGGAVPKAWQGKTFGQLSKAGWDAKKIKKDPGKDIKKGYNKESRKEKTKEIKMTQLPKLQGTEKQVKWAKDIRESFFVKAKSYAQKLLSNKEQMARLPNTPLGKALGIASQEDVLPKITKALDKIQASLRNASDKASDWIKARDYLLPHTNIAKNVLSSLSKSGIPEGFIKNFLIESKRRG